MKIKEWLSIKGIRSEMKHITWSTKKELLKNTGIVVGFCLVFGAYFYLSDAIIALIFRMLRIG